MAIELTKGQLKALTRTAAPEASRGAMHGIYIDRRAGAAVATDGKSLVWANGFASSDGADNASLPLPSAKMLAKELDPKLTWTPDRATDGGGAFVPGVTLEEEPPYPDWQRAIQEPVDRPYVEARFDPHRMIEMLRAVVEAEGLKKGGTPVDNAITMRVFFDEADGRAKDAVRIQRDIHDPKIRGIVMPIA